MVIGLERFWASLLRALMDHSWFVGFIHTTPRVVQLVLWNLFTTVLRLFAFSALVLTVQRFTPVSIAFRCKDWRCVVLREIDFLLKICNSFFACLTCGCSYSITIKLYINEECLKPNVAGKAQENHWKIFKKISWFPPRFTRKYCCYWTTYSRTCEFHNGNGNGLLFHMTQPISRSTIKAIACSKPTISEH